MSSQKTKLIIGVVAIAVVAGAFALSQSYNAEKEQQIEQQENEKIIFNRSEATIKKYVVSSSEGTTTFNKGDDTNWHIEGNEDAPLVQISIDQAIAFLNGLEYTQKIEGGMATSSDYGLDKGITDEAYDENGQLVFKITVGNKTVDETGYYACVDGDDSVYIIDSEAGKALSYGPNSFRDRYPSYVDYSDIKSLDITIRDGRKYSVIPNPAGEISDGYGEYLLSGYYSFDVPVISDKLAENIGGPVYEIFAVDFIDNPESDETYGFNNPLMVCSASDNQGNECVITIGNEAGDGKVYAKFSGKNYVCTVYKEKVDKIYNANMFDIIGKRFINDSYDAFSEITIKDNTFSGTYAIDAENKSVTLNGRNTDMSTFGEIYKSIAAITMDGEAINPLPEGAASVGEIRLVYSSGDVLDLKFYDYDNNYYAVERNGSIDFITGKRSLLQITEAVKALVQ